MSQSIDIRQTLTNTSYYFYGIHPFCWSQFYFYFSRPFGHSCAYAGGLWCQPNRQAIPWKTVVLALSTQLIIGICILKVPFIQNIFEQLGVVFIKVIEYTLAGSAFMFGDFVDLSKTAYIFAFQVLPVILFFSALTSVLYYLRDHSKSRWLSGLGTSPHCRY